MYSHRSTQRYKRKPFVSHYWDCRLKGRPPGTAKSEDPNKRKRKRQARERNLCDVKIKITEYFPGAKAWMCMDSPGESPAKDRSAASVQPMPTAQSAQAGGMLRSNDGRIPDEPGSDGARYYTIQRVNGNGANGKGDGTAGGHKHTLSDSDKVKKSSVQRYFLKEEKERKKSLVRPISCFCMILDAAFKQREATPASCTAQPRSGIRTYRHSNICICSMMMIPILGLQDISPNTFITQYSAHQYTLRNVGQC